LVIFGYLYVLPPSVYSVQPVGYQSNSIDKPLNVIFTKPFPHKSLTYGLTHEVKGIWTFEKAHLFDFNRRKLVFSPSQSIFPHDSQFLRASYKSYFQIPGDVYQIEYFKGSNALPEINHPDDSVVINDRQNVDPEKPLILKLDNYDSRAFEWKLSSTPPIDFTISINEDGTVTANHPTAFRQEEFYSIQVQLIPISYELESGEVVRSGSISQTSDIRFQTARTARIKEILPVGDSVMPDEYITINFGTRMNHESVENGIRIEPSLEYTTEWNDISNRLIIRPKKKLHNDSKYTLFISRNIETIFGAKLVQESDSKQTHTIYNMIHAGEGTKLDEVFPVALSHTFKTVGNINIAAISPLPDSFYNKTTSRIEITYKDNVNKSLIESKTRMLPEVSGRFSWEGSKMIFTPDKPLENAQRYTVHTIAGGNDEDNTVSKYSFIFTVEPKTVLIDVPLIKQPTQFTCNVTAAAMVLQYKGINKTPWDVYDALPKSSIIDKTNGNWGNPDLEFVGNPAGEPGYGVHWEPIRKYIEQYRPAEVKRGWNVTEMLKEIDKGNPSIVWWQNDVVNPERIWWEADNTDGLKISVNAINGMHSEVVVGYIGSPENPRQIILADPWTERWERRYHYISIDRFNYLWSMSFNNTAILVK
jgi:uncharacterized protein YvpB